MAKDKLETVVKLWVEWELGQDDLVFASEGSALNWLEKRLPDVGIEDSVEDLLSENLCGVEEIDVIY